MPRQYTLEHAQELVTALSAVWVAQGRAAGVMGDEGIMRAWFDPLARGTRLRSALDALPEVRDIVPNWDSLGVSSALTLPVSATRLLISAEGRVFSRLLAEQLQAQPSTDRVRIRWTDTDTADDELRDLYRDFALAKVRSVVGLRAGEGAPLLPQAIGQILLLILNGNFGAERSLRRPKDEIDQRAVDHAVAQVVSPFADALVPPKRHRTPAAYSLYSGYAMTEARRRLGSDLSVRPVHLAPGSRQRVIDRLVSDIRRREVTTEVAQRALEKMIEQYGLMRPILAQYGLAQGKPSDELLLRRAFTAAFNGSGH